MIKRLAYVIFRHWVKEHPYYEPVADLVSWLDIPVLGTIAYRNIYGKLVFS